MLILQVFSRPARKASFARKGRWHG